MNLSEIVASNIVIDLGWTLLHSLWQFALAALVLAIALRLLRTASANARHLLAASVLAIAVAIPVVTFVELNSQRQLVLGGSNVHPPDEEIATGGFHNIYRARAGAKAVSNTDPVADPTTSPLNSTRAFIAEYLTASLPFVVVLWLFGVVLFSMRLGGGLWQLRRFRTKGIEPLPSDWSEVFRDLMVGLRVDRAVRLVSSNIVETPIAAGFFKPLIIVPASAFLQISPRELETIIAHELIHIRRYDCVVAAAQTVVETIFFYHPAVWWISSRIREEREYAADAAVLTAFESSHTLYASALANLEAIRIGADQRTPALAAAANGGNLMQRIHKILQIKTEANSRQTAWTAMLTIVLTSAVLTALFCFTSGGLVDAQKATSAKKLAIGFVSIPPLDRTTNAPKDADATMRLLIDSLKRNHVPATGFLSGGMISDGEKFFPVRKEIARMWIDAGFELGLGGFKHIWLYHTPVDEYIANVEKNESVAKKLLGDMGQPPRYFSYPYLNTGKSAEDKAKVEAWLTTRGYTSVKYTFDNQEWMYSWAYDMARNDNDVNTMKEIRAAYLSYMEKMFDHYEGYSRDMFGRDIAQTMVLTSSRLVTDTADDFFEMAAKRGYTFVTVDEAQGDPAYKTPESFVGEAGISWFERWAMTKGTPLRDEPRVEPGIEKMWQAKKLLPGPEKKTP